MKLLRRFAQVAYPLLLALISHLSFIITYMLLLALLAAFVVLLIAAVFCPGLAQKIEQVLDTVERPHHCSCESCHIYHSRSRE